MKKSLAIILFAIVALSSCTESIYDIEFVNEKPTAIKVEIYHKPPGTYAYMRNALKLTNITDQIIDSVSYNDGMDGVITRYLLPNQIAILGPYSYSTPLTVTITDVTFYTPWLDSEVE